MRFNITITAFFSIVLASQSLLTAQDSKLTTLIADLQNGPSIYYTPQAAAWIFRADPLKQARLDESNSLQKPAIDALRAAILLGDMGRDGERAVPMLLEKFPRAVHVIFYKNMHFTSGNGTIEDWAFTYAMTEKKKFTYESPFLPMTLIEKCRDNIYVSVATDIISKQAGRGGKIIDALVDITITLSFYPGACALTQITGYNYDTTLASWRQSLRVSMAPGSTSSANATPATQPTLETSSWGDPTPATSAPATSAWGEQALATTTTSPPAVPGSLTYDELLHAMPLSTVIAVTIKSGSVFKGVPVSVDQDLIKLTVEDMIIPIVRTMITSITRE